MGLKIEMDAIYDTHGFRQGGLLFKNIHASYYVSFLGYFSYYQKAAGFSAIFLLALLLKLIKEITKESYNLT